jgi:CHAT domain-containing protein
MCVASSAALFCRRPSADASSDMGRIIALIVSVESTDARLDLRTIMALPSASRRLAVLSACDTHLSGTQLPDEAVGMPAGLLQAGFAGVVACHWPALDKSAAHLMVRFHELWRGQGLTPATALAEAQRWLRTAKPADLATTLTGRGTGPPRRPPLCPQPGRRPSERRAGSGTRTSGPLSR